MITKPNDAVEGMESVDMDNEEGSQEAADKSCGMKPRADSKASEIVDESWTWRSEQASIRAERSRLVIFDIDGVLSDATGRQHFIREGKPDWNGFFEACDQDPPIPASIALSRVISQSSTVALVTGRPISLLDKTRFWLEAHGVSWDLLAMRNIGDYQASLKFKQKMLQALRSHGFDVQLAIEDDIHICEMFKEQGVPALYIHSGYYE